jgi:excisionase family DNA binding protein
MGKGQINSIKNQGVKMAQGIYYPLPKRLFTLPEAANYLGRSVWSMRELVWTGKIPIVRDGKRIFLDIADLDSYVTKNKMTYF